MKATYRPNPILVWPVHNAMEQNEDSSPQELSRRDFGPNGFRWLTLKRIQYRDRTRRLRFWECAERRTRYGEVDGVAIIARVHSKSAPTRIILEAQYRPAIDAIVIELPAGLVDDQESSAEAAIRELKEETGFVGKVVNESPICYCDPGMTNANMTFVEMDIDGDSEKNQAVKPELEEGEDIEVFLLPVEGLYEALLGKMQATGWKIDTRLLMYAAGLRSR
eukprot:jgi/Botrbrau1/13645/Bobra.0373s0019.1